MPAASMPTPAAPRTPPTASRPCIPRSGPGSGDTRALSLAARALAPAASWAEASAGVNTANAAAIGNKNQRRGIRVHRVGPRAATTSPCLVVSVISKHVGQSAAHLGRGGELMRVVAVGEHLAAAAQQLVDGLREPNVEPLETTRQGAAV